MRHVPPDKHKKYLDPLLSKISDPTKDLISHFVLRLAYCRTEDLRRWFLAQEIALLKWRLGISSASASARNLKAILPDSARLVSEEEIEPLLPKILSATPGIPQGKAHSFYQVPFTLALDLVQRREVFVRKGMAYIPESKLIHLVTAKFRTQLSRQLVMLAAIPTTPALKRTQGFLKNVATVHAVVDEFTKTDESAANLTSSNVPQHIRNMPLCMANLQMAVQTDRHLKHWGRLQYGLFLKGAGLSLEDSLMYFERMFTGKTKDFSKEYGYNFRHMYGKEGKRANYPPYSCSKIINSNGPNANEHHGCPYKHGSVQHVTQLLSKLGVKPNEQKNILAQKQSNNYQLACIEHFKVVHNDTKVGVDNVGNHPNAWFHASVAHHKATGTDSVPSTAGAATPGNKALQREMVSTTVSP